MGHLQAQEMAEHAGLDAGLHWHLTSNHFPPVHPDFIPVAKQAVLNAAFAIMDEDDDLWERQITMPNGITKTVGEIVDGLHLDAFIDRVLDEHDWVDPEGGV